MWYGTYVLELDDVLVLEELHELDLALDADIVLDSTELGLGNALYGHLLTSVEVFGQTDLSIRALAECLDELVGHVGHVHRHTSDNLVQRPAHLLWLCFRHVR